MFNSVCDLIVMFDGSCLAFCDHFIGEEGAGHFAFLWFVACLVSGFCLFFLLVSLVGYVLCVALPRHLLYSQLSTLDTMTKFVILTIWLARESSFKRWQLIRNYAGTVLFNTSSDICFGYFKQQMHWIFVRESPRLAPAILTNIQSIRSIKK